MEISLGGVKVETPKTKLRRIAMLLWGSSGSGKTTLASTAPKDILWINWDPDGTDALGSMEGIHIVDFSAQPANCVMKFRNENPLGIEKFLKENPNIKTVVFDSLTSFGDKALLHGVLEAKNTQKGRSSTLEDPGYSGYGNKNTWTRLAVMNLLQSTQKSDCHVIFIAHEDKPTTNDSGAVLFISIMLGSSLNEQIPVKLSEIWHLEDTGRIRRIAVRPCRTRKPMKTRMFFTSNQSEFVWNYDSETMTGSTIEDWYNTWVKNGGNKIPQPGAEKEKE